MEDVAPAASAGRDSGRAGASGEGAGGAPAGGAPVGGDASAAGAFSGGSPSGGTNTGGRAASGMAGKVEPAAGSLGMPGAMGGAPSAGKAGALSVGGAASGAAGTAGGVAGSGVAGRPSGGAGGSTVAPPTGKQLFADDFESGTDGWVANVPADWAIAMDGGSVYSASAIINQVRVATAGSVSWGDQVVEARIKVTDFGGSSTSYLAGVCGRFQNLENYYCVVLRSDGRVAIRKRFGGTQTTLGSAVSVSPAIAEGTWYTARLDLQGTTLRAYLNGALQVTVTDDDVAAGGVGLITVNAATRFDDVRVSAP